jgi:hypothetical protein
LQEKELLYYKNNKLLLHRSINAIIRKIPLLGRKEKEVRMKNLEKSYSGTENSE